MICLERQWEIEWSWKKNGSDQKIEKMNHELRLGEKINMPSMSMAGGEETWLLTAAWINRKEREKLASTGLGNSNNNGKKRRKHIGIKWHILDRGIAFQVRVLQ